MTTIANSLTGLNKEIWSADMQRVFYKENVAIALANTEFRDQLHEGDTVNKPYRSATKPATYTKGTEVTLQDITGTNEQLSVATAYVVPFYLDDIDSLQGHYPTLKGWAEEGQRHLNNYIDQAYMGQVTNASQYIDDGDVGGTAGTYITPTTSNIQQIFTAAARKLNNYNIPQSPRFAVIGPRLKELIQLYVGGKDTNMADVVGNNGYVGERFGFELYYSNNCYWSATLTTSAVPANTNTISIAGVTFTFVSSIGSTAGNVLIGSAAVTTDYLVDAINGTEVVATAGTHYVAVSADDRRTLTQHQIVAVDATTTMTVTGYGDIATTEAVTDATYVWSLRYSRPMFGLKNAAVDLLVQKAPNVEIQRADKKIGVNVIPWTLYGIKTFLDGKRCMVDVRLNAAAWAN